MLVPQRKKQLLADAKTLAAKLAGGLVTRSEWRHVVDALYLAPGSPRERLARARELVDTLPRSWVAGRSKKTRDQLSHVQQIFREILGKKLSPEELRFLVGWTTRLLHLRNLETRAAARGGSSGRG